MIMVVGVLGVAIALVSGNRESTNLNIKASTNISLSGTVYSDDLEGCAASFYLGCYKLIGENGVRYDLVEDGGNINFAPYVGRDVRVVGRLADIENRNVLMTSSVSFR